MDVTIIIVNYHTEQLIADCLCSVREQTEGVDYEVIVVDNSGDESYKRVIEQAVPGMCRFVDMPDNVGFGRANNAGAAISRGRNLFFLNPDTILLNNAVKLLSDFLDSHPEAGACGGNLYDADMLPSLSFRRILPGVRWELNEFFSRIPDKIRYGKNRRFNHTGRPMEVGYITGADLMIRKELFEQVEGFSPAFFMYYEETDLCKRIKDKGMSVVSVPEAEIQHLEGASFGNKKVNYKQIENLIKARYIYNRRNLSKVRLIVSDLIFDATINSRILITGSERCRYMRKCLREIERK